MAISSPLAHLAAALDDLEAAGLRRRRSSRAAPFSTNDYLGLAARPAPPVAAGAGASRLVAGEHDEHARLEGELASWLEVEACLLFTSGYAANVGAVSALATAGDLVVSDALNHASLVDGARLSRARVVVTPHNDLAAIDHALEARSERRAWVLVESYYSMDADGPDLRRLRDVCTRHGAALVVDDAHALGVLGPGGRGLAHDVAPDVRIGTLGKALGGQGAFVAGSALLCDWLWNRARSFVFSTGLAPVNAAAARDALGAVRDAHAERTRLLSMAERFRARLAALAEPAGLRVLGHGHVVPLLVGETRRALTLSKLLDDEGLWVPPIRPPTVPKDGARLRFALTASMTDGAIDHALTTLARAIPRLA